MAYQYDALHRIKYANSFHWNTKDWISNNNYKVESMVYDANGNIDTQIVKVLGDTEVLDSFFSTVGTV